MEAERGDLGSPCCSRRAGAVRGGEAGTIDGSSAGAEAAFPPCISTMKRKRTNHAGAEKTFQRAVGHGDAMAELCDYPGGRPPCHAWSVLTVNKELFSQNRAPPLPARCARLFCRAGRAGLYAGLYGCNWSIFDRPGTPLKGKRKHKFEKQVTKTTPTHPDVQRYDTRGIQHSGIA